MLINICRVLHTMNYNTCIFNALWMLSWSKGGGEEVEFICSLSFRAEAAVRALWTDWWLSRLCLYRGACLRTAETRKTFSCHPLVWKCWCCCYGLDESSSVLTRKNILCCSPFLVSLYRHPSRMNSYKHNSFVIFSSCMNMPACICWLLSLVFTVMEKPVSSLWTWKNVTSFSLPLFYTALQVFRRPTKCWLKIKNELTLPGAVKFSIPIRSLCSSVNFWKFSSRMRLLWSWVAMSATSFRASMSKQKYTSVQNSSEMNLRKHLPPLLYRTLGNSHSVSYSINQ